MPDRPAGAARREWQPIAVSLGVALAVGALGLALLLLQPRHVVEVAPEEVAAVQVGTDLAHRFIPLDAGDPLAVEFIHELRQARGLGRGEDRKMRGGYSEYAVVVRRDGSEVWVRPAWVCVHRNSSGDCVAAGPWRDHWRVVDTRSRGDEVYASRALTPWFETALRRFWNAPDTSRLPA